MSPLLFFNLCQEGVSPPLGTVPRHPSRSLSRGHVPRSPTRWGPAAAPQLAPLPGAARSPQRPRSAGLRAGRGRRGLPAHPGEKRLQPGEQGKRPGGTRSQVPSGAATSRRGETGRDSPKGEPAVGREESSQLTRAVTAAHGAGEQEGACEQTGSASGRCSAPAPPAPSRSPRYPPRKRGASHMAAGRDRTPGQPRAEARRGEQRSTACPPGRPPRAAVPVAPPQAPPRSCTASSSRRSRFKPLPGRMSTGEGEGGRGGREGGSGRGAGRPYRWARTGRCCRPSPAAPSARSFHLGTARSSGKGSPRPPQALG